MGPQLACGHVLDHTLTQRADGGIGTHGELLLSELLETSIFPQDGAPRPHYGLLSTGYQPSIGHPAQRLSRQRFSALGVERSYFVWAQPDHISTAPDPKRSSSAPNWVCQRDSYRRLDLPRPPRLLSRN